MSTPDDRTPAIPAPHQAGASPAPRPRGAVERRARPAAPMAPAAGGMPNALELLKALRHRWALALTLGLLFGGLSAAVAHAILPAPEYSAQALLWVRERQPSIIFPTSETRSSFETYKATELTKLKSRLVLNTALRDERVVPLKLDQRHPDPIAWLEKKVQAGYQGEVLRISMTGPNPDEVAVLVNAVTDAYIGTSVDESEKDRISRYDQLKELNKAYQDRLEARRKELKNLADQVGSSNSDTLQYAEQLALERRELAMQDLAQIGRQLQELRVRLAVHQESLLSEASAGGSARTSAEPQLAQDPTIARYDDQIADLQERLEDRRRLIRRPSDPALRSLEQGIAQLKAQREEYAARLRTQGPQRPVATAGAGGDQLSLKAQIRILEELEHLARTEIESIDVDRRKTTHETWMLDEIKDELAQIEAKAKVIGGEVEVLNVELKAPKRVTLAEAAQNPRLQPDKRPKMAGMAGFGAFGMALLGVALLEYRARKIHSVEAIVGELQLRLVGALPALPARRRQAAIKQEESSARWRSMLLESVDAMRTLLLRASATESIRSVMITSAVAAEGKTSLASHLATSLARAGRRTLLVDCDLRKPDVHRLFDIAEGPGLGELLRDEVEFDGAIHPSPAADLWILPAGAVDERAIQALGQPGAEAIFRALRERFDFVVVDTAPVLPVADSLLIGQYVDGAIYSVLRSASRVPKVQAAADRLRSVGVPILGAVMTGVQGDLYGSQYSYAYGYGRGYPGSARSEVASPPE